ncbi:MAG: hypothetical protein IPH35_18180 [Rhodoferax sp.]|nr:hypothetical protein [Rhodoferax sp.]
MSYDHTLKPDPLEFYQDTEGLVLQPGKKPWSQTSCRFCNSKDNLAINVDDGGFHCWGCFVNGGDVIDYYRQAHDASFEEACRALGCWVESGPKRNAKRAKPVVNALQALHILHSELMIGYIVVCDLRAGKQPPDCDVDRLAVVVSRVGAVLEAYHAQ